MVVVETSSPRAFRKATLASASTLSESVVRALRGGEGLLQMCCLVASSLGHLRNQRLVVCGSSLQRGHSGSAEESRRCGVRFQQRFLTCLSGQELNDTAQFVGMKITKQHSSGTFADQLSV